MNKRRGVDIAIVCLALALVAIAWIYLDEGQMKKWILIFGILLALFFLILALLEKSGVGEKNKVTSEGIPTELVLLSEEESVLMVWELYGKIALVIGREQKENQVDIDLSNSPYAAMVEGEHAVLNFADGNWYVEDLSSENGIRIRKSQDGSIYKLSGTHPCLVEMGDQILVGSNRLLMR